MIIWDMMSSTGKRSLSKRVNAVFRINEINFMQSLTLSDS